MKQQTVNIPLAEGSMWNLVKIGQVVLEKKKIKIYMILNMYIAKGQGHITTRWQNLTVTKKFYNLNHALQISAIRLSYFFRKWFFSMFQIQEYENANST